MKTNLKMLQQKFYVEGLMTWFTVFLCTHKKKKLYLYYQKFIIKIPNIIFQLNNVLVWIFVKQYKLIFSPNM